MAVAAVPVGDTVQCHLSNEGPLVQDLTDNMDATYFFWKGETLVGRVDLLGDLVVIYIAIVKVISVH